MYKTITTILLIISSGLISSCQANNPSTGTLFSGFEDILRAHPLGLEFNLQYPGILDDPALYKVTHDFGSTQIDLRSLPIRANKVTVSLKPWSSWWFPKKENILFQDNPMGALRKYDLYRKYRAEKNRTPVPASAAAIDASAFNPRALNWEGLCDAWALASIAYPEPVRAVTFDFGREPGNIFRRGDPKTVTFTVGDLKALLLMTYEGAGDGQLDYYGQRFTGDEKGWIHPDLFPDQLHRFVEVMLLDQQRPFVMDHDPGVEVWNVPVYNANYQIEAIPGKTNEVSVRLWVYHAGATQAQDPQHLDFVGTKEIIREYNYILVGETNAARILTVNSGYWTTGPTGANSRADHPDYVISVPSGDTFKRQARNAEIDINTVDEILKGAL